MFALSHHMGKCMMNFPLASYFSHIANFISHGEMHEEFPIRLFFCPFIYQLSHPMGKCMKNFSLFCICCFVGSTFTSNGEVYWEFAFGFLFACSYYQLSHHMEKCTENFLFALSIITLPGPFTYLSPHHKGTLVLYSLKVHITSCYIFIFG
jgi:hypothetical protein